MKNNNVQYVNPFMVLYSRVDVLMENEKGILTHPPASLAVNDGNSHSFFIFSKPRAGGNEVGNSFYFVNDTDYTCFETLKEFGITPDLLNYDYYTNYFNKEFGLKGDKRYPTNNGLVKIHTSEHYTRKEKKTQTDRLKVKVHILDIKTEAVKKVPFYESFDDYNKAHGNLPINFLRDLGVKQYNTNAIMFTRSFRNTIITPKYRILETKRAYNYRLETIGNKFKPTWKCGLRKKGVNYTNYGFYQLENALRIIKENGDKWLFIVNGEGSVLPGLFHKIPCVSPIRGEGAVKEKEVEMLKIIRDKCGLKGFIVIADDDIDKLGSLEFGAGYNKARDAVATMRNNGLNAYAVSFGQKNGFDLANFINQYGDNSKQVLYKALKKQ